MNALKMVHMDSKVSPVSGFLGFCALAHLSFSVTKLITTKLLEKKTKNMLRCLRSHFTLLIYNVLFLSSGCNLCTGNKKKKNQKIVYL